MKGSAASAQDVASVDKLLNAVGNLASLAADKRYVWMELREKLGEERVRPLIKQREFRPIDHAHNARIDGPHYRQRPMCETVFSTIKHTLSDPCMCEPSKVSFENSF